MNAMRGFSSAEARPDRRDPNEPRSTVALPAMRSRNLNAALDDKTVTQASAAWEPGRDLRHGHASHLLAAGVNAKVVSERLGHASVAFTLDTYAHAMPGQQRDATIAAAALIDGN